MRSAPPSRPWSMAGRSTATRPAGHGRGHGRRGHAVPARRPPGGAPDARRDGRRAHRVRPAMRERVVRVDAPPGRSTPAARAATAAARSTSPPPRRSWPRPPACRREARQPGDHFAPRVPRTCSRRWASGSITTPASAAAALRDSVSRSSSRPASTRRCATPGRPAARSACGRPSTCSGRSRTRPARAGSLSASATPPPRHGSPRCSAASAPSARSWSTGGARRAAARRHRRHLRRHARRHPRREVDAAALGLAPPRRPSWPAARPTRTRHSWRRSSRPRAGPGRDAVLLNAGAAFVAAGRADPRRRDRAAAGHPTRGAAGLAASARARGCRRGEVPESDTRPAPRVAPGRRRPGMTPRSGAGAEAARSAPGPRPARAVSSARSPRGAARRRGGAWRATYALAAARARSRRRPAADRRPPRRAGPAPHRRGQAVARPRPARSPPDDGPRRPRAGLRGRRRGAISVLCEPHWFGGSIADLAVRARGVRPRAGEGVRRRRAQLPSCGRPARTSCCCSRRCIARPARAARGAPLDLGLEPLVEAHDEREIDARSRRGAR